MTTGSQTDAINFWMQTPLVAEQAYNPTSRDDWGGPKSVRLQVRRGDSSKRELGRDFGIYLGQHGGKYVVAIWGLMYNIIACELFDSESEMKSIWELD